MALDIHSKKSARRDGKIRAEREFLQYIKEIEEESLFWEEIDEADIEFEPFNIYRFKSKRDELWHLI